MLRRQNESRCVPVHPRSALVERRRAFTKLELIVSLSIIGLLAALVLPAILASRAASRRQYCANNLRQVGVALHGFEAEHRKFPPGISPDPPFVSRIDGNGSSGWISPWAYLLAYLDQPVLGRAAPLRGLSPVWDPAIEVPGELAHIVPVLRCPADRQSEKARPGCNYRACFGVGPSEFSGGAFQPIRLMRADEIRDGLAHTIGVSERLIGSYSPTAADPQRDLWFSGIGAVNSGRIDADAMRIGCDSYQVGADTFPYMGSTWLIAGWLHTGYNHVARPNERVMDCDTLSFGHAAPSTAMVTARSLHAGGVNSLYMDGHVVFMSEQIDLYVWRALATRDGLERVSAP